MIEIVSGSIEDLKLEQKKLLKTVQEQLSKFKKSVKPKDRTSEQNATINKHETWLDRFRISKVTPVKIDHIVINYMLYDRLMKKTKGYLIMSEVQGEKLVISYKRFGSSYGGKMELYDISGQLGGLFNDLPEARIID